MLSLLHLIPRALAWCPSLHLQCLLPLQIDPYFDLFTCVLFFEHHAYLHGSSRCCPVHSSAFSRVFLISTRVLFSIPHVRPSEASIPHSSALHQPTTALPRQFSNSTEPQQFQRSLLSFLSTRLIFAALFCGRLHRLGALTRISLDVPVA